MFNILKNWITSIVVVVIFMALVDMILPSNSLKKYARLVLGLIIIIIIIGPIFNLFNNNNDIEAKINQYINKYDNIGAAKEQSKNNYISSDTINIFKENLKTKIEESIYTEANKKYKVTQIYLFEDENKANFLDVNSITLKDVTNTSNVKNVSKVVLNKKDDTEDYFWDKEVANILINKFGINSSVIKFVR